MDLQQNKNDGVNSSAPDSIDKEELIKDHWQRQINHELDCIYGLINKIEDKSAYFLDHEIRGQKGTTNPPEVSSDNIRNDFEQDLAHILTRCIIIRSNLDLLHRSIHV